VSNNNNSPKKKKNRSITCLVLVLLLLIGLGAALLVFWYSPLLGRSMQVLNSQPTEIRAEPQQTQGELLPDDVQATPIPAAQVPEPVNTVVFEDLPEKQDKGAAAPEGSSLFPLETPIAIAEFMEDADSNEEVPQPTLIETPAEVVNSIQTSRTSCGDVQEMHILLLGIDQMEQADAIRLVQVDFVQQEVNVLAVPRDLFVPIPAMQVHGINQGRINATYGYGEYYNGRGGGVAMLADTLQANFGVSFDHYVVLHFDSISRYIDLLGGVDLVLEKAVDGRPEGFRYFFAGKNHFDGQTAVDFMRIRVYDSDFRRVDRQTQVLLAAYDKFIQQDLLKQAGLLAQALTDRGVVTDLALNEAYALNCLGTALSRDDVRFISIPSDLYRPATTSAGGNVQLPQPGLKQFIQQQMGIHSQ